MDQFSNGMEACFKAFDKDSDGAINIKEFADLLEALFRDKNGKPYPVEQPLLNELFTIFNESGVRKHREF